MLPNICTYISNLFFYDLFFLNQYTTSLLSFNILIELSNFFISLSYCVSSILVIFTLFYIKLLLINFRILPQLFFYCLYRNLLILYSSEDFNDKFVKFLSIRLKNICDDLEIKIKYSAKSIFW